MNARTLNITFKIILFIMFLFFLYQISTTNILNPESFSYISNGKDIVKNSFLPEKDTSSYLETINFNKENYLFDVYIYSLVSIITLKNLIYFKYLLSFLIFFILYLIIFKRTQGKYITPLLVFLFIPVYLLLPYLYVSPEIFSFLFISFFLYVLERKPILRNKNLYYSLPFINLFWANMTVYYITGIILMFIYLIYRIIETIESIEKKEEYDFKIFIISLLGVIIVSLLSFSFRDNINNLNFVKEIKININNLKDFSNLCLIIFILYLVMLFLVLLYDLKGADIGRKSELIKDFLLIVVFLFLLLIDKKYISVFLIISIPVFAYYLFLIFKWEIVWKYQWTDRKLKKFENVLMLILILILLQPYIYVYKNKFVFPEKALKYILTYKVNKNLFHLKDVGGYLEWFLYPEYKIAMKLNAKYSKSIKEKYKNAIKGNYKLLFSEYKINSVLLPKKHKLTNLIKNDSQFKLCYFDDNYLIFVNKNTKDKYFKYIFPMDKNFYDRKNYKNAVKEAENFINNFPSEDGYLFLARLYMVEDKDKAIDLLQYTIEKYPTYYKLYNYLGEIFYQNNEYENAYDILKKSKIRNEKEERLLRIIKEKIK